MDFVGLAAAAVLTLAVGGSVASSPRPAHPSSSPARRAALDVEMGNDLAHDERYDRYISAQFTACIVKSQGVTSEMRACAYDEHGRLDRLLNQAYRQKISSLPPSRKAALRTSERTWLQRREDYCLSFVTRGGGTAELLAYDSCFLNTTIHRTLFIGRFK